MTKPIFANTMHQIIVNDYLNLMLSLVKELSSDNKYANFKEVLDLIIEYHNSYGDGVSSLSNNWNDWLMIIPINTSVMVNGYFAGLQTKRNLKAIQTSKLLLDNSLELLVKDLKNIEYSNE